MSQDFNENEIKQINDFKNFSSFIKTWPSQKFLHCYEKTVAMFTGNQFGKTSGTAWSYVMRILGTFPVPDKNVVYWECENIATLDEYPVDGCHLTFKYLNKKTNTPYIVHRRTQFNIATLPKDLKCPKCKGKIVKHIRKNNIMRFCAATLPGQAGTIGEGGQSEEVKNTQYPAFKMWLPSYLIKRDITARNTSMTLWNPLDEKNIIVDYAGYKQDNNALAGVQRMSMWYDEEPPYDFREECIPRLLAENGDEVFTVTPADHITWLYDGIYEKASVYYRTPAIVEFYKETENQSVQTVERMDNDNDIAVIQAATDDNPTLSKEAIKKMHSKYDDPDTLAIRRYGIFKQVSGRVFKDFTWNIHVINDEKYFPEGINHSWVNGRGIDFHPKTPWGFACVAISPENEAFIWLDANPSPEKLTMEEISYDIVMACSDYRFRVELIDPLAESNKKDSISSFDDINREFSKLRREGHGQTGFWETWDTKGEHGRNEIRKRLKNSLKCERPFNNRDEETGLNLPTIWVFKSCPWVAKSMKNWRWEEYKDTKMRLTQGDKNKPEQRWSHHCMVIEALFKSPLFVRRRNSYHKKPKVKRNTTRYFKGGRR